MILTGSYTNAYYCINRAHLRTVRDRLGTACPFFDPEKYWILFSHTSQLFVSQLKTYGLLLNPHIRCYTAGFLPDLVLCAAPCAKTHKAAYRNEFSSAHLRHVLCTKWRLLEFVWTDDKKMHTNFRIVRNLKRCKWKMQGAFDQEFINAVEKIVLDRQILGL